MGLQKGNPFSSLWFPGWPNCLATRLGVPSYTSGWGASWSGWAHSHIPGIWPTKEELKGVPEEWEELPSPTGRHNYDSAEAFSDSINMEEKEMGLVEGPFTKQEAAHRCGCLPRDLCLGPMAAIDEGDNIRTIYDGSFGGANAHIQQNSTEKTTAPTVMDCVHGIHWLRAAGGATARR